MVFSDSIRRLQKRWQPYQKAKAPGPPTIAAERMAATPDESSRIVQLGPKTKIDDHILLSSYNDLALNPKTSHWHLPIIAGSQY